MPLIADVVAVDRAVVVEVVAAVVGIAGGAFGFIRFVRRPFVRRRQKRLRIAVLQREADGLCRQLWQAAGVPSEEARRLAADRAIGAPGANVFDRLNDHRLVLIVAPMGSGKSLAAIRLYQRALDEVRADMSAPMPVYLRATQLEGSLGDEVERRVREISDPLERGAFVVVDGLDEVGASRAAEILAEARVRVVAWPTATVVLTGRPLVSLEAVEEAAVLHELSPGEARALVGRIAGREIRPGFEASWPRAVRSAILRPLFAVLLGTYLATERGSPTGSIDLVRSLVDRSIARVERPADLEGALRSIATDATSRRSGRVHGSEINVPIDSLLATGFIVAEGDSLAFALPILAQWFASQALLDGSVRSRDLLTEPSRLDRWRSALAIALAAAGYAPGSDLLRPLISADPAFAGSVMREAIDQWAGEGSVIDQSDGGPRLRIAYESWSGALEPLSPLVLPMRDGKLVPLGWSIEESWVTTGWCFGSTEGSDVRELPADVSIFTNHGDWRIARMGRSSMRPIWPWRWALDEVITGLSSLIQARGLPVTSGPMAHEAAWTVSSTILQRSHFDSTPIVLAQVLEILREIDVVVTSLSVGGKDIELEGIQTFLEAEVAHGRDLLEAPWPGPDSEDFGGGWVWNQFSSQQQLRRTEAVFAGALAAYQTVVATWFPRFGARLLTAVTLPATLRVVIKPSAGSERHEDAPSAQWYFDPLPVGSSSTVEVIEGDPYADEPGVNDLYERTRTLRPAQSEWIDATVTYGILDIFNRRPVTEYVYEWLWADLRRIRWVNGLLGGSY